MSESISIVVKVPAGTTVPRKLIKEAATAAQEVITSSIQFEAMAADLRKKGINITAAELQQRSSGKAAGTSVKRKRVTLTPEQKKQAVAMLKAGETGKSVADEFGVSISTIMNLKAGAGLVKKKAAKRKAPTKKPAKQGSAPKKKPGAQKPPKK